MPKIRLSSGEQALTIIETASKTVSQLEQQKIVQDRLEELAIKTNSLISLIMDYTLTDDSSINTDDEILNWTLPDVADELCSSIWNLSSGFYKTAASNLRGGLEMAIVSLYFQICENENINPGYNQKFREWDGGETSTPNWGTTKPKLKQNQKVKEFEIKFEYCPIEKAYDFFKYLCSFTHSRSYSPEDGGGTNSMNMREHIGLFNEEEFLRISAAIDKTIAIIASTWSITYPHIVTEWTDDNFESSSCSLEKLFCIDYSRDALEFAKGHSS